MMSPHTFSRVKERGREINNPKSQKWWTNTTAPNSQRVTIDHVSCSKNNPGQMIMTSD